MPHSPVYTLRNCKLICSVMLCGSYLFVAAIAVLTLIFALLHGASFLGPLFSCLVAFVYLLIVHRTLRHEKLVSVAYMLIVFYTLLASDIIWTWGVDIPFGLLLFAVVIVLAGVLLGARHSLYLAAVAATILVLAQLAYECSWHTPDTTWMSKSPSFGDVAAFSLLFGMLALISWLYNIEMERSLHQAGQAEAALLRQKSTLKLRVQQRTAELRTSQLKELQQMYRFTQLGQIGIQSLHDLANHLNALILEFETIQSKRQSKDLVRAQEIIQYLELTISRVLQRLQSKPQKRSFDIIAETTEVVDFLEYKTSRTGVTIDWRPPAPKWSYKGDAASYVQVISILISNAIEAYEDRPGRVAITMNQTKTHFIISVKDWGEGIAKSQRKAVFEPHHTTKKTGLGIGLYIAKQTVELQFLGKLELSPSTDYTEFVIKLPRQ